MRKYIQIKEAILSEISSGELKVNDKLPVREKLLERYHVSRATLNKAIAELIAEDKLVAFRNRGTFVAPKVKKVRTALVSNLRVDESVIADPNFPHMIDGLKHIIISSGQGKMDFLDSNKVELNLDVLSSYDAVIWLLPKNNMLKKLRALKHKVIIVNRYDEETSYISTNHRLGLREMTEHFIEKFGSECDLTYLDIPVDDFIASERREGFIEACSEHKKFYRFLRMTSSFEENVEILSNLEWPSKHPRVIVSPSHVYTGAILRMAYLKDLKVGVDLFYSDFDNADSLINTGVKIPSVLQDYIAMGREVIKASTEIVNGPVRKYVPHRLVNL